MSININLKVNIIRVKKNDKKNKKHQSKFKSIKKDKTNPIKIQYFTYDDVKQSSNYLHT